MLAGLARVNLNPDTDLSRALEKASGEAVRKESPLAAYLRRPGMRLELLVAPRKSHACLDLTDVAGVVLRQAEVEIKYAGYIKRQTQEIEKLRRHEGITIPENLRYETIAGLSRELQQKLAANPPATLARAARIPGMTPAALSLLLVHAKKAGKALPLPAADLTADKKAQG